MKCNPWSGMHLWSQGFEVSMGNKAKPCLFLKILQYVFLEIVLAQNRKSHWWVSWWDGTGVCGLNNRAVLVYWLLARKVSIARGYELLGENTHLMDEWVSHWTKTVFVYVRDKKRINALKCSELYNLHEMDTAALATFLKVWDSFKNTENAELWKEENSISFRGKIISHMLNIPSLFSVIYGY